MLFVISQEYTVLRKPKRQSLPQTVNWSLEATEVKTTNQERAKKTLQSNI